MSAKLLAIHHVEKASMLRGILSTKEPSAQALQQYEKHVKKQHKSRAAGKSTGFRMPMTSSTRLPAHVPKVNSKWDGMPIPGNHNGLTSGSTSQLAFGYKSISSQSSCFSKDSHLQHLMKGAEPASRSSPATSSHGESETPNMQEAQSMFVNQQMDTKSTTYISAEGHTHLRPPSNCQVQIETSQSMSPITNGQLNGHSMVSDSWSVDSKAKAYFGHEQQLGNRRNQEQNSMSNLPTLTAQRSVEDPSSRSAIAGKLKNESLGRLMKVLGRKTSRLMSKS